jgi:hypothetical protein
MRFTFHWVRRRRVRATLRQIHSYGFWPRPR